jgi:hypothetical protein
VHLTHSLDMAATFHLRMQTRQMSALRNARHRAWLHPSIQMLLAGLGEVLPPNSRRKRPSFSALWGLEDNHDICHAVTRKKLRSEWIRFSLDSKYRMRRLTYRKAANLMLSSNRRPFYDAININRKQGAGEQ